MMAGVTPRMLDWAINGVPVNIYHRGASPDRPHYYATIHDFTRFKVTPVAVVRVPVQGLVNEDSAISHPTVLAKLDEFNRRVVQESGQQRGT